MFGMKFFKYTVFGAILGGSLAFGHQASFAQDDVSASALPPAAPLAAEAPLPSQEQESAPAEAEPSWRDLIESEAQEEADTDNVPEPQEALPVATELKVRGGGFNDLAAQTQFDVPLGSPSAAALRGDISEEAYDAAVTGLFPLSPDQIEALLRVYDNTTKAATAPVYALPEPEVAVQTISLDPGVKPTVIDVAVGHVTSLNILDITGAPWPVHDVSWAGDFEVVEPQEGGHVIRITPLAEFAYGNISIRLLTLKTPITLSLRTSRERVHYRMDARIPEFGPNAQAGLIEGGVQLAAGSPLMTSVLDGVPQGNSERLDVSGADGRTTAYRIDGVLYVRTPLTLLSPGWTSSVSSADGMNVYALDDTPVILLSDRGRFTRATITEKKDIFDEQ